MKTKEQIKQEILNLAKKISETNSEFTLLESARELYEKSILLKHIDNLNPATTVVELKKDEPTIIEEKPVVPGPSQKEMQSKESVVDTPVATEKKQVTIDLFSSEPTHAEVTPQPVKEISVPKEPKATKKKSDIPPAQTSESVGEKLQHKKITDLKASIGINEKFQFINELFEGNMKEYNVAIDQINNFTEHEDAENYLADLRDMYKWNEENPIAKNFLDLVQRRFA